MSESPTPDAPTPRGLPDLGFFAGPPSRAGSSAFGSASAVPSSAVPHAGVAPAPTSFGEDSPIGYLPVDTAPPPLVPQGLAAYPYPMAPPPRGGMPGWAIAMVAVAAGLFIVIVLTALAIPTFLSERERARAEATTIALPSTLEGLPLTTDSEGQARLESMLDGAPAGARDPQGAIYSGGAAHTILLVSARFPHPADQADMNNLMAGFNDGLVSNAPPGVTMSEPFDREPGRLGGRIRCATMSGAASGQICMAADSTSMLTIVDVSPDADPDLPRRVREAVVRRTAPR